MQAKMPFEISKNESFYEKLNEWIGDVFYDILPEKGFDLRDEQIYMAFQVEKAFKEKKVIFAEAGVGTGKTIVYLLYAICYARYTNRPAIIACADETLIEQLVKKEGDIQKLETALGLNVDVRLAKSRDQYLCLKKLDHHISQSNEEEIDQLHDSLPDFVHDNSSMVKFSLYGDRKEYPYLNDDQWNAVGWDDLQDCFTCEKRHRCGQTINRDYYRHARDLIICSQDFYMEHIWTKESRKREGQLTLLPESSCVVFDEGHLLEYASQKALTYRITEQTLESLLTRLMANDVRESTLETIENAISQNEIFFKELKRVAVYDADSKRHDIERSQEVLLEAKKLRSILQEIEEQLVIESEMYVINEYDLKIVEEYLEQINHSLTLFLENAQGICWFEEWNFEKTLVIMPRLVQEIMREVVFSEQKPFIFSSATLSENGSFEYIANSLGIDDYLSFTVASPFNYEENMKVYMQSFSTSDFEGKAHYTLEKIKENNGKTLVLFHQHDQLLQFKDFVYKKSNLPFLFEGDNEISDLVSYFQNDVNSVLCSTHLWEGLDIPGESLSNIVIFSLPFPPNDPVFKAKKEACSDPFHEVDMPYMLLRLKQGIGRLIRTEQDHGTVHILLENQLSNEVVEKVTEILPIKPQMLSQM